MRVRLSRDATRCDKTLLSIQTLDRRTLGLTRFFYAVYPEVERLGREHVEEDARHKPASWKIQRLIFVNKEHCLFSLSLSYTGDVGGGG